MNMFLCYNVLPTNCFIVISDYICLCECNRSGKHIVKMRQQLWLLKVEGKNKKKMKKERNEGKRRNGIVGCVDVSGKGENGENWRDGSCRHCGCPEKWTTAAR